MNIKTLRVFLEVLQAGSLSAAARTLDISQPAVTKQLQALEDELGADLIMRGHSGVIALTPAGALLRDYAEEALANYESLRDRMRMLAGDEQRELNIAASTTPGDFILPALLLAFHERHPAFQVHLNVANTVTTIERVLAGKSDVGFVGAPVQDPSLHAELFMHDEVVLAVPAGHPFASRPSIQLQELFSQKIILREPGSATRETVERQLSEEERSRLQQANVLELGSTHAVLSAILNGAGVGFISRRAMEVHSPQGIQLVCIEKSDFRRDLFITYCPQRAMSPALDTFLNFARTWDTQS